MVTRNNAGADEAQIYAWAAFQLGTNSPKGKYFDDEGEYQFGGMGKSLFFNHLNQQIFD